MNLAPIAATILEQLLARGVPRAKAEPAAQAAALSVVDIHQNAQLARIEERLGNVERWMVRKAGAALAGGELSEGVSPE